MGFIPQGQANLNGLSAPGVYTQILDPRQVILPGAPSNILGILGIATFGPKNVPTVIGGVNDGAFIFGSPKNSKYDLMSAVAVAEQQGSNNFMAVRVTDGTDTASTINVVDTTSGTPVTGLILTAKYSGSLGNTIEARVTQGSSYTVANPTYKIVIGMPNSVPDVYDNLSGTGATLWQNMVNAINNGQNGFTGPSNFVVATIGTATLTPALQTYTLAGGTDGNTTITDSVLIGADTGNRSGMYALRGTECSVAMLADVSTDSTFATQATFGAQEGILMIGAGPSGQSISSAVTSKQTVGIDSPNFKYLVGDFCYWEDTYNNIPFRLMSPQAFVAGLLAALSPEQTDLNKQLNSVIATQTTYARRKYVQADIEQLVSNGLDVVYNPSPGGNYFATQTGQNTSSVLLKRGDQYTRLTYYIGRSVQDGLGIYVGKLNSPNTDLKIKNTVDSFLQGLVDLGMIGAFDGSKPYNVTVSSTTQQSAQGILIVYIQVANYPPIRIILNNLENGDIQI